MSDFGNCHYIRYDLCKIAKAIGDIYVATATTSLVVASLKCGLILTGNLIMTETQ